MARAVYDFQSPNRRTAIGKSREAMSGEIMQFDDAMLESKVEDVANAMPDASGRRDHRRRRIRAQDRSKGVPGQPLRARPDGPGLPALAEDARTQGRPVRVGGDRMLPAARVRCRGGADGDVPGGCVHPAGRRHRPAAVGRPHALPDAFRQARTCVRRDRWAGKRPLGSECPCVFVDGVWRKRSRGGRVGNVGILVAVGIDADGRRRASRSTGAWGTQPAGGGSFAA